MKNFLIVLFSLVFVPFAAAQQLSHPLRAGGAAERSTVSTDTVKILAILVQFQTDTDTRTSGNGRFDLSNTGERIIDAAPHDSAYFADHFIFAKNYFSKASNGRQHLHATVLGSVITLKKQMRDYAPVNSNVPLVSMIEEAWKGADSLYPGFPFQSYDLFTIFHAGVGRDIDLRSVLGYDPTPLDIPSLYFNLSSFRSVLGGGFNGFVLPNSSAVIPNTVVLPETEVRRIPGINGDFVLKLGINGLLVASIGSYLGLPDLFDTKTGKSGIGRFGLMDGQSIFSFSGIAPPEPSAWEKISLGWSTPITVTSTATLPLPAAGLHATGNDTIYKIPISAKEYFLVENRQRDVNGNGQTVTMKWNGQIFTKTFAADTVFFENANIDSVYGVVLDVEELDWSLPGVINAFNNYRGGALVWHIDESVIEQRRPTNSVNADPEHRGVDLEEADGSQDIGQSYEFGDPASGSEDGSPIDYWFNGNIFPNYRNEFSEQSLPNSLSNTNARSHITLRNFSASSSRMTFDAVIGSGTAALNAVKQFSRGFAEPNHKPIVADRNNDGTAEIYLVNGDTLYALSDRWLPFSSSPSGVIGVATVVPAVVNNYGAVTGPILATAAGSRVELRNSADSVIHSFTADSTVTTPLAAQNGTFYYGTVTGTVEQQNASSGRSVTRAFSTAVSSIALLPNGAWIAASGDSVKHSNGAAVKLNGVNIAGLSVFRWRATEPQLLAVRTSDHHIRIFDAATLVGKFHVVIDNGPVSSPAFADMNGDGSLDIVVGTSNGVAAYNVNGTLIESFPYRVLDGGAVTGTPVIVGMKNSSSLAIIFGSTNGHLYAVSEKGKLISGFPLQTGGIAGSPAIANDRLFALSEDSSAYSWTVSGLFDTARIVWNGFLGNTSNTSAAENNAAAAQRSSELLPKKFAYNWPNPVYGGTTNIRYYLGKSAAVTITVVNLAGELVDRFFGPGSGGMDNEVAWNVSNVQSGIYFAQITAAAGGEEASQIVKIAVVK